MTHDGFILNYFLDNRLNIFKGWSIFQVYGLYTGDPFSVVKHFMVFAEMVTRLDESVKNDVAIKVDYGNSCETLTLIGKNPFTIKRQNLSLLSPLVSLIQHIVKHHWLVVDNCVY